MGHRVLRVSGFSGGFKSCRCQILPRRPWADAGTASATLFAVVGFPYQLVEAFDGGSKGELRRFGDEGHQEPVFLIQVHGEKLLNGPTGYRSPYPFRVPEAFNESHDDLMLSQHAGNQKTALFSLPGARIERALFCEGVGNKLAFAPRDQRVPGRMFVAGAVLHSLDERSLELPKLRQHPGMMMLYRNEGTLLGSRVLLPYLMHDFSPVF